MRVAKNYDWSRKITLLSNLTRKALLVELKLKVKPELKMLKSQVRFCNQSIPVCLQSWMFS